VISLAMKLQRQLSRIVGSTQYAKWVVTLPPSQIVELGWREGDELDTKVKGKAMVVRKANRLKSKPSKMTYEQFRDKIRTVLKSEPEGLSWTEIKHKLKLPQRVPNNLWVRTLDKDIGLVRKFDSASGKTIWRLK
jgi:antitoxin component of MazEF toxin-antitoxin module